MCTHTHTHTHTHTTHLHSTSRPNGLGEAAAQPGREGQTHPQRSASRGRSEGGPHLVHVDVVKVVLVVDGLEHALQLPGGAAVDHQDEGDSDRVGQHILH